MAYSNHHLFTPLMRERSLPRMMGVAEHRTPDTGICDWQQFISHIHAEPRAVGHHAMQGHTRTEGTTRGCGRQASQCLEDEVTPAFPWRM